MKPPKSEPYQRSRQRAALHAWVVAATAVASIGMPSAAVALGRDIANISTQQSELTPLQSAHRVASYWLDALRTGDRAAVLSAMRLPAEATHESDVYDELGALSDWMNQSGATIKPIAHQHAGHWALSAWRIDTPEDPADMAALIEPVTLYHPAPDGLFDHAADWQVVPLGYEDDPALAPLYNADHAALMDWYQTLV